VPGEEGGTSARRAALDAHLATVLGEMDGANAARETALRACRRVIRSAGSSIRAIHQGDPARAAVLAGESEADLRTAQQALGPFPAIKYAGFLHDAEKEYVEARAVAALVDGQPVPGPAELVVGGAAWMRGLAEAASELRRHLLDQLRQGDVNRCESLLGAMQDVYDALMVVDHPDALTGGLRRTLDALRAVLERTRGDVTTSVLQVRLQQALLKASGQTDPPGRLS
jgi:translin